MLLKAIIRDEAGKPVPCRVGVYAPSSDEPVEEACCLGEHLFAVPNGEYRVEARRGKLYRPAACTVQPGEGSALAQLTLERIVNPVELGLYCFDAHSHVSRDDGSTNGSLGAAALIMKSEEFHFFFVGSPYDADVHFEYLQRDFSDQRPYRERYARLLQDVREPDFLLDIGNELVKGRYGHIFLMNYEQRPPFSRHYDEAFDRWIWDKSGSEPAYDIAYPYEAVRQERGENSVAVAAHPTSWWWHDDRKFITNLAATIGFDALAGCIDAMVVMGYQSDRPSYQALWYDLLDNGYFLPGIAETDTVFDRLPAKFLRYKTYAWLEEFSIDALCHAVRAGRCIATSGPLIRLEVDGQLPGSVLPFAPGQCFEIEVQGTACCDGPLSCVQIIVNGRVAAEYTVQGERCAVRHALTVDANSYVLAKCYDTAGNLAIVNPVYIRNEPFVNQGYRASVRVDATANGQPAVGSYWLDDGPRQPFQGGFQLAMPPAATLHVLAAGQQKAVKLFELPELQAIFANLYTGGFLGSGAYSPGEAPVEAFQIRRIRELLDDVRVTVEFNDSEESS